MFPSPRIATLVELRRSADWPGCNPPYAILVVEMSYPRNCRSSVPTADSTDVEEANEESELEATASQLSAGN